jgi:hypothetical protein
MELNSLWNSVRRFVSEAGSEQSTHFRHFRGWDSLESPSQFCRKDLNNPRTLE